MDVYSAELDDLAVYTLLRTEGERLFRRRCFSEALAVWRSSYFLARDVLGFYDQATAVSAEKIAQVLVRLKRFEAALPWWRTAYFIRLQNLGAEHEASVKTAFFTALCCTRSARHGDAQPYWVAAYRGYEGLYGRFNATTLGCLNGLINNLVRRRQPDQAVERGMEALSHYRAYGCCRCRSGDWLDIAGMVAESLSALGKHEQSAEIWSLQLTMLSDLHRATPEKRVACLQSYATSLEKCGQLQSSLLELEQCIELSQQVHGDDSTIRTSLIKQKARLCRKLQRSAW